MIYVVGAEIFIYLFEYILSFQSLNCKLDFFNPADNQFGLVWKGLSTGLFKELIERKLDTLAGSMHVHETYEVLSLSTTDFCFLLFDNRNKGRKNGGKYKSVHI